jgi:hypothetical protein
MVTGNAGSFGSSLCSMSACALVAWAFLAVTTRNSQVVLHRSQMVIGNAVRSFRKHCPEPSHPQALRPYHVPYCPAMCAVMHQAQAHPCPLQSRSAQSSYACLPYVLHSCSLCLVCLYPGPGTSLPPRNRDRRHHLMSTPCLSFHPDVCSFLCSDLSYGTHNYLPLLLALPCIVPFYALILFLTFCLR